MDSMKRTPGPGLGDDAASVGAVTAAGAAVGSTPAEGPAPHRRSAPMALLVAMRPRQWVKNLLVYAVPLAAGQLTHRDVLVDTTVAFVCFCAVASATYLLNDVIDAESDRAHPRKRFRPIASGELSRTAALIAAVVLALLGLLGAALSTYPAFLVTLAIYLVATVSYSLGLKNEPVVELAVIAAGFVLRAIAGGTATGIPMSPWFLTVAAFGSLFMAAGKRYSEFVSLGPDGRDARPALAHYTATYLRFVWSLSAAIMLTAYCLWAFQVALRDKGSIPFAAWSVVPFILAVLRFALDIDRGDAGAPEDIVLGDRVLQLIGLTWAVMFALGAAGI
jgi:decaprenyl-phosphate phosphoribosyltransferase